MARKTCNVDSLRDKVNRMIQVSHARNGPTEERHALNVLLESVLHETDNYRGFQYLDGAEAVRAGTYDDSARKYH